MRVKSVGSHFLALELAPFCLKPDLDVLAVGIVEVARKEAEVFPVGSLGIVAERDWRATRVGCAGVAGWPCGSQLCILDGLDTATQRLGGVGLDFAALNRLDDAHAPAV